MKKKILKVLALVACAVLLVVGSIAGTLAYMTSKTETVKNTFTVGNVAITLDELDVDEYGVAVENADPERVMANEYKLIPGHKYVKDPTIHVAEGSEVCYLFVEIANGIKNIEASGNTTIAKQLEDNNWVALGNNIYYLAIAVDARDAAQDVAVFTTFTVADDADWKKLTVTDGEVSEVVTVTAYAVQADGFADAVTAWNATFGASTQG